MIVSQYFGTQAKTFEVESVLIYLFTAMRVEWAKTKARGDRWHEEVLLVTEEMRRVLYFLEWKAQWWLDRGDGRPDAPIPVQQGLAGYAAKQAAVCHSMATSFAHRWYPIHIKWGIPINWPLLYTPAVMDID